MQAIESVHGTSKRIGPVAQIGNWQNSACQAGQTPATRFTRNAEIYGEGEPSEFIYQVMSGAVRVYSVLSDGRRQIGAFYLPGDYFGFEAGEFRAMSAEAVTEAKVRIVQRVSSLASCPDADLTRELWSATVRELQSARKHLVLLVRRAEERVASFLLEMAERTKATEIELPMSRQDIADYLGLTIETVSRTLTHLEEIGAISLRSARRILLEDRRPLQNLNT